jgi:simple sugar transport system substrate-binding protein
MRRSYLIVGLVAAVAALMSVAVAGAAPSARSTLPPKLASGKVQIAVVRQLASGDFFAQWIAGAQKMAKALHIKLAIYDAQGDNAKMATDFQNAMNRHPAAIITDHGLASTMDPLVDQAVKKGIPVVSFDLETPNQKVTQVEQSDVKLGTMIATKMAKDLHGQGKIGYVYVPGFAPLDRRNTAWQAVKKKYPGLDQVAQFGKVSDSTASDVESQAAAVLTAHPDLTAFLAPYDEFAKGCVLAVNQAGKQSRVKVYGVDISTPDIGVMTAAGSPWVATAATDPANVGAVTVRAAALRVMGVKLPRFVDIPPTVITQSFLRRNRITNMARLRHKLPGLNTSKIATARWMPKISF